MGSWHRATHAGATDRCPCAVDKSEVSRTSFGGVTACAGQMSASTRAQTWREICRDKQDASRSEIGTWLHERPACSLAVASNYCDARAAASASAKHALASYGQQMHFTTRARQAAGVHVVCRDRLLPRWFRGMQLAGARVACGDHTRNSNAGSYILNSIRSHYAYKGRDDRTARRGQ